MDESPLLAERLVVQQAQRLLVHHAVATFGPERQRRCNRRAFPVGSEQLHEGRVHAAVWSQQHHGADADEGVVVQALLHCTMRDGVTVLQLSVRVVQAGAALPAGGSEESGGPGRGEGGSRSRQGEDAIDVAQHDLVRVQEADLVVLSQRQARPDSGAQRGQAKGQRRLRGCSRCL